MASPGLGEVTSRRTTWHHLVSPSHHTAPIMRSLHALGLLFRPHPIRQQPIIVVLRRCSLHTRYVALQFDSKLFQPFIDHVFGDEMFDLIGQNIEQSFAHIVAAHNQ